MECEETENICNMPEVLTLEIHKSEDTGKYYATFIGYSEKMEWKQQGKWLDTRELKESFVEEIVSSLMENVDYFEENKE